MDSLQEEDRKMRMLRLIVDLNQAVLMQQRDLTLREAYDIVASTRQAAVNLFPGKEDVFDLIYARRLKRIIRERFVLSGGRPH
jgi:hypothetical protein